MPTVLVVDDEPEILRLLSAALARDYSVVTAESGFEALALYSSYHAQIDAIVTDITMPGMSGVELIARVEEFRGGPVPVVFMTGYSETPVEPYHAVLAKPFPPALLKAELARLLG